MEEGVGCRRLERLDLINSCYLHVKVHVNCAIIRIACLIRKDNEGNERSVLLEEVCKEINGI